MRTIFGLMIISLVLIAMGCYAWMHLRHTAEAFDIRTAPIAEDARQAETTYSEPQDAPAVTLAGLEPWAFSPRA